MLLLAPLLAEAVPVPRAAARPPGSAGAQGTDGLFRWMADHAPIFRVPGSRIQILTSPDRFYQAMKVSADVGLFNPQRTAQAQFSQKLLIFVLPEPLGTVAKS